MCKRIILICLCIGATIGLCFAALSDIVITETKERTIAVAVPNGDQTLGIVLLGDAGDGSENQKKVATAIEQYCAKEICSFVLMLGDNIYERGVMDVNDPQFKTKFEDPYSKLPYVFFPVIGNHDLIGNWQAEVDYRSPRWYMGGRYYAIDTELASIFALDTNLVTAEAPEAEMQQELEWLQTQLSATKAPWKIIFGHHPVYSHGLHGNNKKLIEYLQPIISRYHVDFYIAGHDHDKELIEIDGTKYVISGTGARPRKITLRGDAEFAASTLGFAHLALTSQTAALKFIDADGRVEYVRKISKGNKARVYDDIADNPL